MKLSRFFELIIRYGISADPRKDKLNIGGFSDTAILNGPVSTQVHSILVGIDIDVAEILIAERMRSSSKIDLVLSHHPQGRALAGLDGVMKLQVDVLRKAGVRESIARGFIDERCRQLKRRLMSANHNRSVDAARLLRVPFVCCHTPADNHAYRFVSRLLELKRPRLLKDIIDILLDIAEYRYAANSLCGPRIILGNPGRPCGKIFVEMTGGAHGPEGIYSHLYRAGVRTVVSMHLSEEHFKKVIDADMNVVIAGHISSDTLGLNLILDNISRHEDFDIKALSGFTPYQTD